MTYSHAKDIREDDPRQEDWAKQRTERGFDDTELWNLDTTIAKFIHPRLAAFKGTKGGYPGYMNSEEEWENALDKMIFAFEFLASHNKHDANNKATWAKVDKGLRTFAKHFGNLWN
jgi:hypothetical protein